MQENDRKTIVTVVGARPNFMKIAPISAEFSRMPAIRQVLVHTGQHYDENLSKVFFDELGIPRPDVNLGVGSGDRETQIAEIMQAFAPVLDRERPAMVLVVGDVNSTIACARVARERSITVVHVEAGLRSFDASMPEEHNRRETDEISDLLFVTEPSGMENLQHEAVPGQAFLVGNVMIDTLVANLERARQSTVVTDLGLREGDYCVATFHRPSNVDSAASIESLIRVVESLCARSTLVIPLHPRTRASLERAGRLEHFTGIDNLVISEPLGYLDFMRLVMTARAVVTDSGGLQEETTYLRVPCLTMRENTERPVTIDVGSNQLVGTDHDAVVAAFERALEVGAGDARVPDLWDGRAASRIGEIIANHLAR